MPTVLDFLSKVNPTIIDEWDGKSYSNTKSNKGIYDNVIFNDICNNTIQEWTDFTYEAISLAYGDILAQTLPANFKDPITPTTTPRTIVEEDGIDALGEAWTCNVVRGPIKTAGAILRPRPAVAAIQSTDPFLSSFKIKWNHPEQKSTDLDPDWAVLDRTLKKVYQEERKRSNPSFIPPQRNLAFAVGDSKMWQKWQSAWLQKKYANGYVDPNPAVPKSGKFQKTHEVTNERLKPLAQLATYCRFAETRYAFVLTQKELVAFRARRIDPKQLRTTTDPGKLHTVFEYKSVPWDASGPGKLTVNLAIWALGCMGMNDAHRVMEAPGNKPLPAMVRLTKWTHDTTRKLYRNVISGREISEADWSKLGARTQFVHVDNAPGGSSPTNSFTVANVPSVAGLTQGMQNVNLNASAPTPPKPSGSNAQNVNLNAPRPLTPSGSKAARPPTTSGSRAPSGSNTGPPKTASPAKPTPKKYVVEGSSRPGAELIRKEGKLTLNGNEVKWDDAKKKYYVTIPTDARTRTSTSQIRYLKQL